MIVSVYPSLNKSLFCESGVVTRVRGIAGILGGFFCIYEVTVKDQLFLFTRFSLIKV